MHIFITPGDIVAAVLLGPWLVFILGVLIREWWRKRGCKHDGGVGETQACDAICRKCGKNLGFIGNRRK